MSEKPNIAAAHEALLEHFLPFDALKRASGSDEWPFLEAMYQVLRRTAVPSASWMAAPQTLDRSLPRIWASVSNSTHAIVRRFASCGYLALSAEERCRLFATLIESGDEQERRLASHVRLAYMRAIWGSPLGSALTGHGPARTRPDVKTFVAAHTPPFRRRCAGIHEREQFDYAVIGSGPAGATIAYTLQARGKRVVLIEKGPFVCHGSMDTRGCADLMFDGDRAFTTSGGILIRSGETVGGGSTVNVDLAFSPLLPMIGRRIAKWAQLGLIEPTLHTPECLMEAYEWVQTAIGTRSVGERDRNNNNQVLWDGAEGCGFNPQLYHLNRDETPTGFDWNDKRDAARQLLIDAMCDANNPLALIPNADAEIVLNQTTGVASGVRISINRSAWTGHGHTFVDPCGLGLAALPEGPCELRADAVIVAAGTLGSTRILLKAAAHFPELIDNPAIGRGPVIHPSMAVVGRFAREIRLLEGLDSAVYVDALGLEPGVVLEAMSGLPEYGAMLTPGSGEDVLERLRDFQRLAGFGVMLVDEASDNNRIALTSATTPSVDYSLSAGDRDRLAHGVSLAVKVMLRAGAEEVWLATNENILGVSKHDPTRISVMKTPADADRLREQLHFITNRTILSASHLQASNKSGLSSATSVVSPRHRVWNMSTGEEIPNLYVMDSSVFPESVGANPMQTVYTFARIFAGALP